MNAARSVMLVPFTETVADACGRLHAAADHEHPRLEFEYQTGVLRGYYYAGAVAEVQLRAALDLLRAIRFDTGTAAAQPCAN